MGWAAIIAALIQLFGPILEQWLKDCTQKRAEKAASRLPPAESYGNPAAAVGALFDEMLESLPRWALVRRNALKWAKSKATDGTKLRTKPLTTAELADGLDQAAAAADE